MLYKLIAYLSVMPEIKSAMALCLSNFNCSLLKNFLGFLLIISNNFLIIFLPMSFFLKTFVLLYILILKKDLIFIIHLIGISLGINNLKVDRKILITIISKNLFALKEIKSVSGINYKGGDSSLKRIGNFIKEARLSKNQSIEELASDLKIGAHQLEAIEEGNEEKLPEKVFIKAMIRRISQKLKLDTEFLMDEFKTEKKEVKIEEIVEEVSKKNYKYMQSRNPNPVGFLILI